MPLRRGLKILLASLLGAFFLAFFISPVWAKESKTVISIGVVLPLSGENASQGEDARRGIELALALKGPELLGKGLQVKLVFVDDRSDPERGLKVVRGLIEEDHVRAIIGPFTSPVFLAVAPRVQERRVVMVSGSATTPQVRQAGDYAFTLVTPDDRQGRALARFAYEILRARIGVVFYLDNDYGRGLQNVVRREFQKLGGQIKMVRALDPNATEFHDLLHPVKELGPHCVFFLTYPAEGGLLLKQARELGIETPFLGGDGVFSQDLIDIAGEAARNTFASATNWRMRSPEPSVQKFVKQFIALYGVQPNLYSASYFDAANVVLESLLAGKIQPEAMRDHIAGTRFDGATGEIDFRGGHAVKKSVDIYKVEDYTFDYFQTILTN